MLTERRRNDARTRRACAVGRPTLGPLHTPEVLSSRYRYQRKMRNQDRPNRDLPAFSKI